MRVLTVTEKSVKKKGKRKMGGGDTIRQGPNPAV